MLVNRLPGPRTMTSASAIAASASSRGRDVRRASSQTRSIPVVRGDPATGRRPRVPSRSRAWRMTRRRRDRHDLAAHGEDPVHLADALLEVAALDGRQGRDQQVADGVAAEARRAGIDRSRSRPPGSGTGAARPISGSASASATMQLRMSPTAGTPSCSRSSPDEPPSSATVTTAVRLLVCSLRPRSRVERPVPPPIATICGPRARNRFW